MGMRNYGSVWYVSLNTCFQFLNNITHIFTHFFIYMYFKKNWKLLLKHTYQTCNIHARRIVKCWKNIGLIQKKKRKKKKKRRLVILGLFESAAGIFLFRSTKLQACSFVFWFQLFSINIFSIAVQCLHFKLPQPMNMNVAERQRECHSQLLSSHDARDLLNSVDAFLFDCDGLIPLTFNFNFHSSSLYTHIYFWISISIFVMCIKFTKNTAGFCFYRCDMEGWYTHRWSLTDIRYASLQGTHSLFLFLQFFFLIFIPKFWISYWVVFFIFIFFSGQEVGVCHQ